MCLAHHRMYVMYHTVSLDGVRHSHPGASQLPLMCHDALAFCVGVLKKTHGGMLPRLRFPPGLFWLLSLQVYCRVARSAGILVSSVACLEHLAV